MLRRVENAQCSVIAFSGGSEKPVAFSNKKIDADRKINYF
jgi:hypothetical protein